MKLRKRISYLDKRPTYIINPDAIWSIVSGGMILIMFATFFGNILLDKWADARIANNPQSYAIKMQAEKEQRESEERNDAGDDQHWTNRRSEFRADCLKQNGVAKMNGEDENSWECKK